MREYTQSTHQDDVLYEHFLRVKRRRYCVSLFQERIREAAEVAFNETTQMNLFMRGEDDQNNFTTRTKREDESPTIFRQEWIAQERPDIIMMITIIVKIVFLNRNVFSKCDDDDSPRKTGDIKTTSRIQGMSEPDSGAQTEKKSPSSFTNCSCVVLR